MAHDDAVLAILQSADGPTTAPAVAALIEDVSTDVIRKTMKRLCANGDLREVSPAAGKRAATYQI